MKKSICSLFGLWFKKLNKVDRGYSDETWLLAHRIYILLQDKNPDIYENYVDGDPLEHRGNAWESHTVLDGSFPLVELADTLRKEWGMKP
jgi:hypothetical protein